MIFFPSCVTYKEILLQDAKAIEESLYEEIGGKEIIWWTYGVHLLDLDLNDRHILQNILVEPDPENSNGNYITIILENMESKRYHIEVGNGFSIYDRIRLAKRFIINNNYPQIAEKDYLLVYSENLQEFYDRKTASREQDENARKLAEQDRESQNKLLALLINPLMVNYYGQFKEGERVTLSKALLRIIDSDVIDSGYIFLVAMNDNNVTKPFYIISTRIFNMIDFDYPNTVFENLKLEYIGIGSYMYNGIPRETFIFKEI
jgi:hypothetical protein